LFPLISLLLHYGAHAIDSQDQECPADWFDAGSLGCYKFLDGKVNLTWVEAQLACELQGGYLAEPTSQMQVDFLSELALLEGGFTGVGFWYIGLTDLGKEGDWSWIHSGSDLGDEIWSSHRPNNKSRNSDDCVVMVLRNNEVFWEDHSCISPDVSHHPVAPVCQADTSTIAPSTSTTSTASPTTTAMSCPSGWTEFQRGCYKLFSSSETWVIADSLCLAEGARLTSVHSMEEEDFLNSLSNGNSYWIGGYPKDNSWVWSDFSSFDYQHGYDNNNDQCLYQYYSHIGSGWSSHSCATTNYEYYRICKLVM